MENASKALIIAGAILLSILIIAIGIFIFNSSNDAITDSLGQMDKQQIDAFNAQFSNYQGEEISGSNVKALLSSLASNYSSYKDEPSKVPAVCGVNLDGKNTNNNVNYDTVANDDDKTYTNAISFMRNKIVNKHVYKVEMVFGPSGIIDTINITNATK